MLEINDVVLYSDLWSGGGGSTLVGRGRALPLRLHTRWRRSPVGRTDRGESGAVVRPHGRNSRLQDLTVGLHTSSFGFSTADFLSPFCCILFRHFNHCHVLSHRIHKLPLRPSPFPLSCQFHPQHPSPNFPIIFRPYMSIPSQSCLPPYFLPKPSHLRRL